MLKKGLAISLFLLLFIQIIGYHLVFIFQQLEIKRELISILKTDAFEKESTSFVLNNSFNSQVNWEGDAEFSYKGRWYDVVKFDIVNGVKIVRCFSDDKETALVEKYRNISGSDFGTTLPGKTIRVLKQITVLYDGNCMSSSDDINTIENSKFAFLIVKKLPSFYREIPKPPPASASA
jgi:hypothetical protein